MDPRRGIHVQTLASLAAVLGQIEGENAFEALRTLQNLRVTQCAPSIVVTGAPMLLHAEAREVVVLRMTLIVLGAVDQLNDVVDLALGSRSEQPCFGSALQLHWQFFQE